MMNANAWKFGTIILVIICVGILFFVLLKGDFGIQTNLPSNESSKTSNVDELETQLEGEVFIVTRGRDNVKLGLNQVRFYKIHIPTNEIEKKFFAITNSDGKFSIKLPQGTYKILAESEREVFGKTEKYAWRIPITLNQEKQSVTLSNNNQAKQ